MAWPLFAFNDQLKTRTSEQGIHRLACIASGVHADTRGFHLNPAETPEGAQAADQDFEFSSLNIHYQGRGVDVAVTKGFPAQAGCPVWW